MRKGLLISTMLVSVAGFGASAEAANQCLQTPSCESLGYTQTSCVDNNGVKCPFGNKYFCVCPAKYVYSCSGTGYAGGKGTACGGKYTECTCASGYVWENGSCVQTATWGQCTGYAGKNCNIGDILFSDGTCAADKVTGKTPIAVVVYISSEGCGQALALKGVDGTYRWASSTVSIDYNISALPKYSSSSAASQDFASCKNSKIIMADGDKNKYPAVWAAYEYSTTGTKVGDWCLPAAGICTSYKNNQTAVEGTLDKLGGTKFTFPNPPGTSTQFSASDIWICNAKVNFGLSGFGSNGAKHGFVEVRPVIEF